MTALKCKYHYWYHYSINHMDATLQYPLSECSGKGLTPTQHLICQFRGDDTSLSLELNSNRAENATIKSTALYD